MVDLRELDFFNVEGEPASKNKFSRRDSGVELQICFDYELARECPRLVELMPAWKGRKQKARAWVERAAEFGQGMEVPQWGDIEDSTTWRPFVPTAVLLAKWFPKPWLCGELSQRQEIVKLLVRSYSGSRPLFIRPYPLDPDKETFIRSRITMDNTRKEYPANFKLYLLAYDWTEPLTRSIERFVQWHQENNPTVERQALLKEIKHLEGTPRHAEILSRFPPIPSERSAQQNRSARVPLERLTCYRLSKLPPAERRATIENIKWLTVIRNIDSKISRAKAPVEKELDRRGYMIP